jgi:8-oxo-dGTP pyrophosphatase MutT (NUDIX family)
MVRHDGRLCTGIAALKVAMSRLDQNLPQRIARRLALRLPGLVAGEEVAPELTYGRHKMPALPDTRRAAVLVLLRPTPEDWRVPLIVRPETMSAHAGQVSFPGGEVDGPESLEGAAIREYEEELGVAGGNIEMLGRLSPLFVYASNFLVTPCVGVAPDRPEFRPNASEVAAVLEPTIAELTDQRFQASHEICRGGVAFRAPHIAHRGYRIWGATRMMLAELTQVLREVGE